jgi:hypothetical protein
MHVPVINKRKTRELCHEQEKIIYIFTLAKRARLIRSFNFRSVAVFGNDSKFSFILEYVSRGWEVSIMYFILDKYFWYVSNGKHFFYVFRESSKFT